MKYYDLLMNLKTVATRTVHVQRSGTVILIWVASRWGYRLLVGPLAFSYAR